MSGPSISQKSRSSKCPSVSRFCRFVKILLIVENDRSALAELHVDGNSNNLIAASLRFGNITDSLGYITNAVRLIVVLRRKMFHSVSMLEAKTGSRTRAVHIEHQLTGSFCSILGSSLDNVTVH